MRKITPCLWFDSQAEEAADFYTSVFSALGRKKSKVLNVMRYGEADAKVSGKPKGSVMTVTFALDGQEFMALNGGPIFKFTEAISFIINCKTQDEIDVLWEKLSEGGDEKAQQCGWLKDKYGVSWQIVPAIMDKLMRDKNPAKTEKVMEAMLPMKKLDIEKLKQAYREG